MHRAIADIDVGMMIGPFRQPADFEDQRQRFDKISALDGARQGVMGLGPADGNAMRHYKRLGRPANRASSCEGEFPVLIQGRFLFELFSGCDKISFPLMLDEIISLRDQILAAIAGAGDAEALEAVRIQYLARSGSLPVLLEKMATVPKEQRPVVGKAANEAKNAVASAFEARKAELTAAAESADFDPTLPGRYEAPGSLHPVLQVRDRAIEIFRRLGFALADGPDIENEVFNFDALNTPADHPARNEQDTFYLKEEGLAPSLGLDGKSPGGRRLMRTQTSTVQIRAMLQQPPPIRIIAPGRCFRRDEIDATHGMSFFQMEGLVVDEGVTLADLKGTLEYFFRELLGEDLKFRFRPHFFPFTEPSFEVDCSRAGSQVKGKEWLEICGCGMVDPEVFRQVGYDAEKYSGYAFGFGLERIAIMRHGIPDLRFFTDNDVRFLRQFSTRIDG